MEGCDWTRCLSTSQFVVGYAAVTERVAGDTEPRSPVPYSFRRCNALRWGVLYPCALARASSPPPFFPWRGPQQERVREAEPNGAGARIAYNACAGNMGQLAGGALSPIKVHHSLLAAGAKNIQWLTIKTQLQILIVDRGDSIAQLRNALDYLLYYILFLI